MNFFKYVFNQSKRGLGKAILFGLILGLIYSLSMFVSLKREFNEEEIRDAIDETGCEIVEYELTCDVKPYYKAEGFIIDLNYNEENVENKEIIILTRENIIIQGTSYSYKILLTNLNFGSDFNVDDLLGFINSFYIILFFVFFIIGTIFYLAANIILAFVMMFLINSIMKTTFKYKQMYKLTIYIQIPYVLLNALTRIVFGVTISELIPIPLVPLIFNYTILFILTYIVVKYGYEPEDKPEVELPFEG